METKKQNLRRAEPRKARRSVFEANQKGALKLGAAMNAGQFWTAAQALIGQAAPSSRRWLCIWPIRMATAMMFLRETKPGLGRSFSMTTQPSAGSAGDTALLKELFARHPAFLHFRRTAGLPLVHLGPEHTLPAGETRLPWPGPGETKFGVALAFWKRKQIQGVLFLHRAEEEGDFSAAELKLLRELHPHLETAFCRVISMRRLEAQNHLVAGILKPLPLPMVLCDWRLKIICESAVGLEARTNWELGDEHARIYSRAGRRALPPDLAEFCRARVKVWETADPAGRSTLEKQEHELEQPHERGSRVEVSMVRQKNFPLVEPFFLIRFKPRPAAGASAKHRPAADHFGSLARLSACERKIAQLVCEGHSNAGISRQLGKSVHTVKAQLHSIFKKLQVKSRSKLFALTARASIQVLGLLSCDFVAL